MFKIKINLPTKALRDKVAAFWAIYRRRLRRAEAGLDRIIFKRFFRKYDKLQWEREQEIDALIAALKGTMPEDFLDEQEEFFYFYEELLTDEDLESDDFYELVDDYACKVDPQLADRVGVGPEIKKPKAFDYWTAFFTFDNTDEDFNDYWGLSYNFDFSSDHFFLEFCLFILFFYFFLDPLIALILYFLYMDYFINFQYDDIADVEDPYGEDFVEDAEDEELEFFFDEGNPDDQSIFFEDWCFHKISKRDLEDFYFFHNFSAQSHKYFIKFNKKFKRLR